MVAVPGVTSWSPVFWFHAAASQLAARGAGRTPPITKPKKARSRHGHRRRGADLVEEGQDVLRIGGPLRERAAEAPETATGFRGGGHGAIPEPLQIADGSVTDVREEIAHDRSACGCAR